MTTIEEYKKMGEAHTGNDRKIDLKEIDRIEKHLNGHCIAWSKMWNSGENHGHMPRIMESKVTKSKNSSDMYLLYKDHKIEPGKTRPVVTGNTSDTRGMSNNVSDLLEAVANSEQNPYEVNSTEDMLARTKVCNEKVKKRIEDWERKRMLKLNCSRCKFEEISATFVEEITYKTPCEETGNSRNPRNEMTGEARRKEMRQELADLIDNEKMREKMKEDCEECGQGLYEEDRQMCLIGNDVVALFPSIKSQNTGRIVRKRIEKSPLKFEGFEYRHGARYIVMNRKYTGDLKELWGVLPYRRKVNGVAPGMTGKAINDRKEDDPSYQWIFPKREPTDRQKRLIIARVAEIGVRVVFENFTYRFGGDTYKQREGGPIGARVTMAAARLVMQEWGETYLKIMQDSGIDPELLAGYVDDGRQGSAVLRQGMRFSRETMKFEMTEEAKEDDRNREETPNQRMSRICLPAMNAINEDLTFTVEIPEDFKENRLPTLDFLLWLERNGLLNHTYYEKDMKTPYLIMRRSAMSEQQRSAILSNELVRRLSNVNVGHVDHEEVTIVIEQFIQQLKNSGYSQATTKEAVVNGIKGWQRKHKRREAEGKGFYRLAHTTLKTRVYKKLRKLVQGGKRARGL